jgi:hypothetical protein
MWLLQLLRTIILGITIIRINSNSNSMHLKHSHDIKSTAHFRPIHALLLYPKTGKMV